MDFYKYFLKPVLFSLEPEATHWVSMKSLQGLCEIPGGGKLLAAIFGKQMENESFDCLGLKFPNRVGLAAGFDKNATYTDQLATLGFGHIEIGTITPKPQIGNPRPRLFRLPEDEAIINRMGFNNGGAEKAVRNLAARKNRTVIIGGNIGKNKHTPNEDAWKDYLFCFRCLYQEVDYFTINLSSPNTPGLRSLLGKKFLMPLLEPIQNENKKLSKPKPILLKIPPDLEEGQLEEVVQTVFKTEIKGIVATNTTIGRAELKTNPDLVESIGPGGLSGKPLQEKAEFRLNQLKSLAGNQLIIISSGGIMNEEIASRRITQGAEMVQLYSGLIFSGPSLVGNCRRAISKL